MGKFKLGEIVTTMKNRSLGEHLRGMKALITKTPERNWLYEVMILEGKLKGKHFGFPEESLVKIIWSIS